MATKTRRTLVAIGIVAIVIIGGCAGTQPTESAPTTTSEVTTTASISTTTADAGNTKTTVTESPEYPTGFDTNGFQNSTRAIRNHVQLLSTTSYRSVTIYSTPNENITIMTGVNATTQRVYRAVQRNDQIVREFYFENGTGYTRSISGESTSVTERSMEFREALLFDGQYENLARASLGEANMSKDGEGSPTLLRYPVINRESASMENSTGNVLVTKDGLVPEYSIITQSDEVQSSVTYQIGNLGDTIVQNPNWAPTSSD